jgi:hypothetical protein
MVGQREEDQRELHVLTGPGFIIGVDIAGLRR